jgi:hypothetical protein
MWSAGAVKRARTPQIAHSRHQNHKGTIAVDVIANPAFMTIEK